MSSPWSREDILSFLRLLAQDREAVGELQKLLRDEELRALGSEVRGLAASVRELAEAQRRTEERLEALTLRVDQLAEAQRRTEERLEALTLRVDQLAEAQRVLAEGLKELADRVGRLAEAEVRMEARLGQVRGEVLERRYADRAPAYFGRLARKVRVVRAEDLAEMAEEWVAAGVLSEGEAEDLLLSDLVLVGRARAGRGFEEGDVIHLVVEVSAVIDVADVERAARRAALLERGLRAAGGEKRPAVLPVVAGERILGQAEEEALRRRVFCLLNGSVISPGG